MRWLLIMLAVGAAGTASYLGIAATNSFSAYSGEQLDMLQKELDSQQASSRPSKPSVKRAEALEHLATSQSLLLQEERQRRLFFRLALGLSALAALAAFLVRPGSTPAAPSLRGSSDEDARLLAAVGDPEVIREGARQKAATLLGVAPNAPPAVIDAALQVQLQQRDISRLDGLAPDLKALVLKQREELVRARDLLVNGKFSESGAK